jgi:protein SCO1
MQLRPARKAWMIVVLPLLFVLSCRRAPSFNGQVVEPPKQAPDLAGVNWDGKPFRLHDHRGKVAVIFFGYTYCPDVCPFTLARMKQLYAGLGERAKDVEIVFVSVDPKRDTVDKLARYVPNFDRRFYGLRIEQDVLLSTAKAFDVSVQYGMPKDGPETESYYYVDHTGTFFVVDRDGRLRLTFPPGATVDQMLPDIEKLLAA